MECYKVIKGRKEKGMAKFSYQDLDSMESSSQRQQVGFFGLKNHRDEAIVRFAFNSLDELEFVTVHNVSVNGKYRKANCIRELNEPVEKCPLCQANISLQQRVFVKLIQYDLETKDANGRPTYSAKVWERSANFAKTLQTFINEYGTLSDYVFKIVRNGNAGDMKTTYEVLLCSPQLYPSELYTKDFSAFDNYTVVGTIVIDEDANGLRSVLNGTWQPKSNQPSNQQVSVNASPVVTPVVTNMGSVPNVNNMTNVTYTDPSAVRPKRTYTY